MWREGRVVVRTATALDRSVMGGRGLGGKEGRKMVAHLELVLPCLSSRRWVEEIDGENLEWEVLADGGWWSRASLSFSSGQRTILAVFLFCAL